MLRVRYDRTVLIGLLYIVLFACFLTFGLFHTALYFSPVQTYTASSIVALGLIGLFIVNMITVSKVPVWVGLLYILSAYALLTGLWSANPESAVRGALLMTAAAILVAFVPYIKDSLRGILLSVFALLGPILYLFAMCTQLGWFHFLDAIQYDAVKKQLEMDSVFQYHNAFASFELASLITSIFLAFTRRSYFARALYMCFGAIDLSAIAASTSREVWVLTPLALVAIVLVSSVLKRGYDSLAVTILICAVGLLSVPMTISFIHHASVKRLLLIISVFVLGSLLATLLVSLMTRIKKSSLRWSILGVGIFLAVAVGMVIVIAEANQLHSLANKLNSLNFNDASVQGRLWYYGAGLHMWLSNPVLGTGYGSWDAKFQAFQQYPYWSTTPHSALLNQLINFGLVGTLLWVVFIGFCVYEGVRAVRDKGPYAWVHAAGMLSGLSLLLHSLLDFDMDFPTIMFACFVLLACGASARQVELPDRTTPTRVLVNVPSYTLMGLAVAFGTTLSVSEVAFKQAQNASDQSKKMALFEKSASWAPYNGDARASLATLYFNNYGTSHSTVDRDNAWNEAQAANKYSRWDPSTQQGLAVIAYQLGHWNEAYHWSQTAYDDGVYTPKYAGTFMGIALWAGVGEYKNNPVDAQNAFRSVIQTYKEMKTRVDYLNHLKDQIQPMWAYQIDAASQSYAATAEYCLGNYSASLKDMKNMPSTQDPDTLGLAQVLELLDKARIQKSITSNILSQVPDKSATISQEFQMLEAIGPQA